MLNSEKLYLLYYESCSSDYISINNLKKINYNYYEINKMIESNNLQRISKGKYQITENFKKKYEELEKTNYISLINCIKAKQYNDFFVYYKVLKNSPIYKKEVGLYLYFIKFLINKEKSLKYDYKVTSKKINNGKFDENILKNILENNFFVVAKNLLFLKGTDDTQIKTTSFLVKEICNKLNERKEVIIFYIDKEEYYKLVKYLKEFYTTKEEGIIIKLCLVLCEGYNRKTIPKIIGDSKNMYEAIKNRDYKKALYFSDMYCFKKNINKEKNILNVLLNKINILFYNEIVEYNETDNVSNKIQAELSKLNETNNICIIPINNNKEQLEKILSLKKFINYEKDDNYFYIKYTKTERDKMNDQQIEKYIYTIKDFFYSDKFDECIKLCNYILVNTKTFNKDVIVYLKKSHYRLSNKNMYKKINYIYDYLHSRKDNRINNDLIIDQILYNKLSFDEAVNNYNLSKNNLIIIKLKVIKKLYLFGYIEIADKIFKSLLKEKNDDTNIKKMINELNNQKKLLKLKKEEPKQNININLL